MSQTLSKVRIFHHPDFPQPPRNVPYTEINQNQFFADIHIPYVENETPMDRAKSWLEIIQNYNYKILPRTEDFGKLLDFSDVLDPAKSIKDIFNLIDINSLDIFSTHQLTIVSSQIKEILILYAYVMRFDTNKRDNIDRPEIMARIFSQKNTVIENFGSYVAYSQARKYSESETELKLKETVTKYESKIDKYVDEIKTFDDKMLQWEREIDKILGQLRDGSALKVVRDESENFSEIAKIYDQNAKIWFWSSFWMGIFTFAIAVFSAFSYKIKSIAPVTNLEYAQLISGKIIILGILSYGLITCIRNYTAQTHNAVVNRHRQNSLETYHLFVNAVSGNVTRDIVLSHAAAAVFSPQDTGYVRNQDTTGARSIIEMIPKSIVGDTKPG